MDTCYNYVIYNYVNFAWRIFHRMHRFNIESSQPVLAYIALIDVNIKVSLIIHLSMTFVNMLSLRGRRGSGEEREGGGGGGGGGWRRGRNRFPATVSVQRTGSDGRYGSLWWRDAGSWHLSEWNGAGRALARLRRTPRSPLFLLPLSRRAREETDPRPRALRPAVVGVPRFARRRDAARASASSTGVTARLSAVALRARLRVR